MDFHLPDRLGDDGMILTVAHAKSGANPIVAISVRDGSRKELVALLSGARGKQGPKATDQDVAAEEAGGEEAVPPTQRRERFGIIRMDLSAAPAEWSITRVNPRFIWEATAQFSNAGPF